MLDLKSLTEEFIHSGLSEFRNETIPDEKTVIAVKSRGISRSDREEQVRNWLYYYHVLRSYPIDASRKIASKIVEFSDQRESDVLAGKPQIFSEYMKLKDYLQPFVPPAPKTGDPRNITSLTSKALWCCYPHSVPIYDDYSARALQVICRICKIKPEKNGGDERYGLFLDAWLQLFEKIKPVIEHADLDGYPTM